MRYGGSKRLMFSSSHRPETEICSIVLTILVLSVPAWSRFSKVKTKESYIAISNLKVNHGRSGVIEFNFLLFFCMPKRKVIPLLRD
jgi:NADH:ubiquinone oxidoreductase subunit 4 (subunit M)